MSPKLFLAFVPLALFQSALMGQASFRVDDATRPPGEPVTFRWKADVAVAPVLNPGNIVVYDGEVRLIPPSGRTTYTLSYRQGKYPKTETVVVETGSPPQVVDFRAESLLTLAGQPLLFSFSSPGADRVSVWVRPQGQKDWVRQAVTPENNLFTLSFQTDSSVRLEAANAFGAARAQTDVGVISLAGPGPVVPVASPTTQIPTDRVRRRLVPVELMTEAATRSDAEKAAGLAREDFAWMELLNDSTETVALNQFRIEGDVSLRLDLVAGGTVLAPGQRVLLVNNRPAYLFRHGEPGCPLFELGKNLNPQRATFRILQSADFSVSQILYHTVSYDTARDGLETAAGAGHSLVPKSLIHLLGRFGAADWKAGARFGGTPGEAEPADSGERLQLAEIFAAGTTGRAVEIFNASSSVTVGAENLWQVTGAWANAVPVALHGFVLPGQTSLIWKDAPAGQSQAPVFPGLSLDPAGGKLGLARSYPGGFPRHLIGFSTYGAMGAGQARVRTVTTAGNVLYRLAEGRVPGLAEPLPPPPDVVISKIHFTPLGSSAEFVEVTNRSAAPRLLEAGGKAMKIKGFDFAFPKGTVLASGETVTVGNLPEASIRAKVALPAGRRVFTGTGKLDDGGEHLGLEIGGNEVTWAESMSYDSKAPWPTAPLAQGWALSRLNLATSGEDPANWVAVPVPGPSAAASTQASTSAAQNPGSVPPSSVPLETLVSLRFSPAGLTETEAVLRYPEGAAVLWEKSDHLPQWVPFAPETDRWTPLRSQTTEGLREDTWRFPTGNSPATFWRVRVTRE